MLATLCRGHGVCRVLGLKLFEDLTSILNNMAPIQSIEQLCNDIVLFTVIRRTFSFSAALRLFDISGNARYKTVSISFKSSSVNVSFNAQT